jgi:5'-nucleotidase (lipoprotein e(P4) family)
MRYLFLMPSSIVRFLIFSITLFVGSFCIALSEEGKKELPNDIRWVRESREYQYLCQQIYTLALQQVKEYRGAAIGRLAVVVDLDETVLDNSLYQVDRWQKQLGFTQESWSNWVNQCKAMLVPGAGRFLKDVRGLGVTVVFVSNRMESNLQPTKKNLEKLKVLHMDDIFLLRQNIKDTKNKRRNEILEGTGRMASKGPHKVIAYLGDQMGDFPTGEANDFGKHFFLFPNPTYGKW